MRGSLAGDHARFVDEERIAGDAGYADNVHHNHVRLLGLFLSPIETATVVGEAWAGTSLISGFSSNKAGRPAYSA